MDYLVRHLRQDLEKIPDHRAPNTVFKLEDVLMSALAMFSLKYPSLLRFEQQTQIERDNLVRLFKLSKICSDAQMRRILDEVPPQEIQAIFSKNIQQLEQSGLLHNYRFLHKHLLVSIDGVEYFRSRKIHCHKCQQRQHQNGEVSYSHAMLAAVLVHPNQKEVFPLANEAIQKQDGQHKNDCEQNASKRLQARLAQDYKDLPIVVVEDALYANEPHIKQVLANKWDYIISVKPTKQETLFTYFNTLKELNKTYKWVLKDGKITHYFYWINNAPLNHNGLRTNLLYYEEHHENGKVQKFSWVTSLRLSKSRVFMIMRGSRARWKIENETFNTLKNQGYNFEHNYGHGYKHLCNILACLMLLAFLFDQMVQACSKPFQQIWQAAKSKVRLWEGIRALFLTTALDSFEDLMQKMAAIYQVQLE